jgi:hypothetical protein
MNSRELASLAIKLIAFYIMASTLAPALASLWGVEVYMRGGAERTDPAMIRMVLGGTAVAYALLFLCVIRLSDRISALIVRSDTPLLSGVSTESFQIVAFSCVGLFLLGEALPSILQVVSYRLLWTESMAEVSGVQRDSVFASEMSLRLGLFARLVIGTYLFLRPAGIANLWKRLQKFRPMNSGNN